MPRNILATTLLTASLAFTAPVIAAPKAAKPATAQINPQRQPENSNPPTTRPTHPNRRPNWCMGKLSRNRWGLIAYHNHDGYR